MTVLPGESYTLKAPAIRLPQELWVDPIDGTTNVLMSDPGDPIPHTTYLFREDAQLEDVLDLGLVAYRKAEDNHQLTVVSAGSSIGTEAYSILAYLSAVAPELGRVSLVGFDTLPRLNDNAQNALYRTQRSPYLAKEEDPADTLPAYGFNLSPFSRPWPERDLYNIDATAVRDAHEVDFRIGDLRDPELEVPEADIIFCNNLLFHLYPEEAETIVRNMISNLRVGGIFSVGRGTKYFIMKDDSDYPLWRREISKKLEQEGVVNVLDEVSQRAPFVFRKLR